MPVATLADLFGFGVDILGTSITDGGVILAQTGDVVAAEVISDNAEWWQHVGLASRPSKAVAGKAACQAVTISTGSNDIAVASRDVRGGQIYGNLKEGETALYAAGPDGTGQAAVLLKADGSTTILATDTNTAAGNGVYFKVAPDKFQMVAPWGVFTFDATGVHIKTNTGARFDLGAISAPAPLDSLVPSYCKITAGTVSINGKLATTVDSPMITLGQGTGPLPLAPLMASLIPAAAPLVPAVGVIGPLSMTASTKILVAV